MIIIKNLSKSYKTNSKENIIFDNISLSIKDYQRIALLGGSGSGKSTLLNLITGEDNGDKGYVFSNKSISWPIGSKKAFHPLMTVIENIIFISRLYLGNNQKEINEKINFINEFSNIGNSLNTQFRRLPNDFKTKIALGLSMAFEFDFYVIDGISYGDDQNFREKTKNFLINKLENKSFIMIDKNLKNLEEKCNRAFVINNKKISIFKEVSEGIIFYKKIFSIKN